MHAEDLIQGTQAWLDIRKKHITATDASVILGVNPYKKKHALWCEKLDLKEPEAVNSYMQRGSDLEPVARELFQEETGTIVIPKVVFSKDYPFMMASLDGISINNDFILEIKANGAKNHSMACMGEIPPYHFSQIQHQLEVSKLDLAYYFSFDGKRGITLKIYRDEKYIKNLIEKELEFWHCLQFFIPPKRKND